MDIYDYDSLLQMSDGYAVRELEVHTFDWLANRSLVDLNLSQEGILILGIRRSDGAYLGSPAGKTVILADNVLILYGRQPLLAELSHRERGTIGEGAHKHAMAAQRSILDDQTKRDVTFE